MAFTQLGTYLDSIIDYRYLVASATLFLLYPPTLRRILGHAKTTYWHSPNSIKLTYKPGSKFNTSTGTNKPPPSSSSLADFIKSLLPPCRLNPFLFNGHLQTIWTTLDKAPLPVYYRRWIFENEEPTYTGSFSVDFVVAPSDVSRKGQKEIQPRTTMYDEAEFEGIGSLDSRPMLVMLHGLSGGSHELYLRHVLAGLTGNGSGGWEACVVNSRGCAGSSITTSMLYNARATWDIRQTVRWLRRRFPNRPLYGCGFSLGANIMTNYVGEEGAGCELKAACVVSNPWNLAVGSIALQRTWIGLNVYSRSLGSSMKKLAARHEKQIAMNPKIDLEALKQSKYLHDFDRLVQAPTFGYPTEDAYYRDASSTDSLLAIRIPFLGINAQDDPVALDEALPYKEVQHTPYAVMCTTSLGGHLSWYELGGGRWFARAAVAFFKGMNDEVDFSQVSRSMDTDTNGEITRPSDKPIKPEYDPMRRKLYVSEEQ